MNLDLSNPAHREALRWACEWRGIFPHMAAVCDGPKRIALDVLSSPKQSAAIVRAQLEGCGVRVAERIFKTDIGPVAKLFTAPGVLGVHVLWIAANEQTLSDSIVPPERVPALVLTLLACTDAAGALAALRKAGR